MQQTLFCQTKSRVVSEREDSNFFRVHYVPRGYFHSTSLLHPQIRTQIDLPDVVSLGQRDSYFVYYWNVCGYLFNCNWTQCKSNVLRRTSHRSPSLSDFFFGLIWISSLFTFVMFVDHLEFHLDSLPGSNCTVISFSDFLIKIYSVRCN